ncbi:tRNA lysidine(34) synthetase TilS [Leucobacter rhizosphaerae]|uniref:tRNA(Ile)-lysidine synthase n=1 Tax=Leucobacter rhizosphaerae TaxID=2932245 RepID=A0ABY4FUW8_9MICO|nr:tRNA lysidine(34) synthetase TilS [Leucobacter rhizosphaerae]UOQ60073.1 tRNA lysidine(34) synthetase TilS [Leucobacter rhizosphaerae]
MEPRAPLHPAVAATRVAVRRALSGAGSPLVSDGAAGSGVEPRVLVALSGGADSLALAAALAFEAPRAGWVAGAVIVDHGLQPESERIAAQAAAQATALGLAPAVVRRVSVVAEDDGPEAAARDARYAALAAVAEELGAALTLTAHTRDDQAEQVLLGIARGSGARSLAGIPPTRGIISRPFLDVSRQQTEDACAAQELTPWQDPHNADPRYTRVRVRSRILPLLEAELGPGVAAALARTAAQLREDADAFETMVAEQIEEIVEPAEAGIAVSVAALQANPAALRHRLIRRVAEAEFGSELSREHTLGIAALVTDWRGQGPIFVPGIRVTRVGGRVVMTRQLGSPRASDPRP